MTATRYATITIRCRVCGNPVMFGPPEYDGGPHEGFKDEQVRFEWERIRPDCGHCTVDGGTMTNAEVLEMPDWPRVWRS